MRAACPATGVRGLAKGDEAERDDGDRRRGHPGRAFGTRRRGFLQQCVEFAAALEDRETGLHARDAFDFLGELGMRLEVHLEGVGLVVPELAREVPLDHVALGNELCVHA